MEGLTSIDDEVAAALGKHKGEYLSLAGLQELSADSAASLAAYKGVLYLNGSPSLNIEGLPTLSDEAAEALSQKQGRDVFIGAISSLSDQAIASLAKLEGVLYLQGLTSLSDEAAKALANHTGQLLLNGVTEISDEAIKALSAHAKPD